MRRVIVCAMLAALVLGAGAGRSEAAVVPVRYVEGVTHGFLTLRSQAGEILAEGDLLQVVRPEGVDSRVVFHFRDGSLHDETVVFSQQRVFSMLSYRLVQRGPIFPDELDVRVEREGGRYEVRSRRHDGGEETARGEMTLPPDVYNGMQIVLLKNLAKDAGETAQVLAFTPKPTLVALELTPIGRETALAEDRRIPVTHYVLKPKLGVIKGALAALIGKKPADYHCWIATSSVPAFVSIEGPLYVGGPIWRIETTSPRGPGRPTSRR
ncbi:MAG TPA: hypothetical protein VJX92_28885 [Methylomirabilota bacterium]|nr:hypothetical protein [Methylomirabilota bacterium]